ncbi:uncharacterized protein METZ01_LOCUS267170, partial [marine metagenome]
WWVGHSFIKDGNRFAQGTKSKFKQYQYN